MTKRRLTVIAKPEPGSRLILTLAEGGLRGAGPIDLVCGLCDGVLAAGVPDEQLHKLRAAVVERYLRRGGARVSGPDTGLVLKCPSCGAYNEVPSGGED